MSQKTLMDPLPRQLTDVPEDRWPVYRGRNKPVRVLISKKFMVQIFTEPGDCIRLSVNRVKMKGRYRHGQEVECPKCGAIGEAFVDDGGVDFFWADRPAPPEGE